MEEGSKNTNEFELIAKVQLSGSLIAKDREAAAFQSEIDDPSSGFIFAPQKKETYNIDELKKSVDVEVVELIPESPETELDLVPRPIYEEALEALSDALDTIETQSQTIAALEAKVAELETEIETLREEIDNEKLLRVLAEESSETIREENLILNTEVQTALQRSVLEGIEKSSLEARNEGLVAQVEALKDEVSVLQKEIDSLVATIEGKEAAIEAGAKAGNDITVLVTTKQIEDGQDLVYRIRNCTGLGATNQNNWEASKKQNLLRRISNFIVGSFNPAAAVVYAAYGGGTDIKKWLNGPNIELYNFTSEQITVTIRQRAGKAWLGIDGFDPPQPAANLKLGLHVVTLAANEKKIIKLKPTKECFESVTQDEELRGSLVFTTKSGEVTLTTALQKQFGADWKNNPKLVF